MALEEVGAFNKLENKRVEKPVPSQMRDQKSSVIETTFGGWLEGIEPSFLLPQSKSPSR